MFSDPNTLTAIKVRIGWVDTIERTNLLNNIGAELLNRKRADIADELTNNCIAEPVVIEVENVLDNLTERYIRWEFFFPWK
jgi:hypothetical protein